MIPPYKPLEDDVMRVLGALCDAIVRDRVPLWAVIIELRKGAVKRSLAINKGHRTRAARDLGLTRTALYWYINKYGFFDPQYSPKRLNRK